MFLFGDRSEIPLDLFLLNAMHGIYFLKKLMYFFPLALLSTSVVRYLEKQSIHARKHTSWVFSLYSGPLKSIWFSSLVTLKNFKVAHFDKGLIGIKFLSIIVQGLHFAILRNGHCGLYQGACTTTKHITAPASRMSDVNCFYVSFFLSISIWQSNRLRRHPLNLDASPSVIYECMVITDSIALFLGWGYNP